MFLRRFNALAERIGIPAIAVQGLRRTYITRAFDVDFDESVILDQTGCPDSRITHNVY